METKELKSIRLACNAKLKKLLTLNRHCIEAIQYHKAVAEFKSLLRLRIIKIIWLLLVNLLLGSFLYAHLAEIYISVSAGIVMAFNFIAIAGYVTQIAIIAQIGYSENRWYRRKKIALMQASALLQLSIIKFIRFQFLSLPFYAVYIIIGFAIFTGRDFVVDAGKNFWIVQVIAGILLIPLSGWVYKKISPKNLHIRWVRELINYSGGKAVAKAMSFIKETDE